MAKTFLGSLLLPVLACGTSRPGAEIPLPTRIPGAVLASWCSQRAEIEGEIEPMSIAVVTSTGPIDRMGLFALEGLSGVPQTPENWTSSEKMEARLAADFRSVAVEVPEAGGLCLWRPIEAGSRPSVDDLVLTLSSPFHNPYSPPTKPEIGLVAQLAIRGRLGDDWYWVPLIRTDGTWHAGDVRSFGFEGP